MDLLSPEEYERVMNLTRTGGDPTIVENVLSNFLKSPEFNRLQVYSNQAIRILDNEKLKYLYVSDSHLEQIGFTKDEIIDGGLWFTFRKVHPLDILKLGKVLLKLKKTLETLTRTEKLTARFTFDLRFKTKHKGYRVLLQTAHVLALSPDDQPYILLFATTDITEYKQINSMNYSLSVKREEKGFVNILEGSESHDTIPISPREREVLHLTSLGLSEKQISDKLSLSIQTVKTHRKNMLHKANAKNSVEMVRMGIANGWI